MAWGLETYALNARYDKEFLEMIKKQDKQLEGIRARKRHQQRMNSLERLLQAKI